MNELSTTSNQLPAKNPASILEAIFARKEQEAATTLSEAMDTKQSQLRSEIFSASSKAISLSGAMPGEAAKLKHILSKTRPRRLTAYMQLNSKTIADTKGWRIRSAYRLICYMARIMGDLQGTMMLANLQEDKFTQPFDPPARTDVYGAQAILQILHGLNDLPDEYTLPYGDYDAGLTYLPPPIPDHFYNAPSPRMIQYLRDSEPANYDPSADQPLDIWLTAYDYLAGQLRICDGTEPEPEAGIFGTVGLFTANSARMLWPTRDELLQYEQNLMLNVFDRLCGGCKNHKEELIGSSVQAVEHSVIMDLGYGRGEAVMLVKTALRYGTGVYEQDIDMNKVRELKALDVISDKAALGDDTRAQIAARKQIHLLAGYTKDVSQDSAESFRELAGRALDDDLVLEDDNLLE